MTPDHNNMLRLHGRAGLLCLLCAIFPWAQAAQGLGVCQFDATLAQFRGAPVEQARCLLRHVEPHGSVRPAPASLPLSLEALIDQPTGDLQSMLPRLLRDLGVRAHDLGGVLDAKLSAAADNRPARYFVIHDTSWPWLGEAAFPPDDSFPLNDLKPFSGRYGSAHVFVNRLGRTATTHAFSEPWRATKLEMKSDESVAKGRFLHIELLQPRRRDPAGPAGNDALAPSPGFTGAQYERLALLYVLASARSGRWLIPAFHGAMDDGLPGAHDDPQNFDLLPFVDAVMALRERLSDPPLAEQAPDPGLEESATIR
ncbi:hypothetical protein [Sphaerotilus sp.]|uniref:hypothetical protein n=1 Tax=Sphaerotilus sp. TaxID=2093942 RepID=UPI0034E2B917